MADLAQARQGNLFPFTPKSLYCRARQLQLQEMQALGHLAVSLAVVGAAAELFSPLAIAYADKRGGARDSILKNLGGDATNSWLEGAD